MRKAMLKPLWKPSAQRIQDCNMFRFMKNVNGRYGTNFANYNDLYQWSVDNLAAFWAEIWRFADIKASKAYNRVIDDPAKMPGAQWFSGSRLNFAENLLRFRDDQTALIFRGEDFIHRKLTYKELFTATAKVAASLRSAGVVPGDRVLVLCPTCLKHLSPCPQPQASGESGHPAPQSLA